MNPYCFCSDILAPHILPLDELNDFVEERVALYLSRSFLNVCEAVWVIMAFWPIFAAVGHISSAGFLLSEYGAPTTTCRHVLHFYYLTVLQLKYGPILTIHFVK